MNKLIIGISALVLGGALFALKANKPSEKENTFISIPMQEALEKFKIKGDFVILDVRRQDEYESGHIPGAMNIPNETIEEEVEEILPNKDQIIYVYCRSGNRSKQASEKLVKLGYTNIYEFGGILDYTGELEY